MFQAMTTSSGFDFGLDPEKVAAQLEALAADIRAGRAQLQRVARRVDALPDDFQREGLTLSYCRANKPKE